MTLQAVLAAGATILAGIAVWGQFQPVSTPPASSPDPNEAWHRCGLVLRPPRAGVLFLDFDGVLHPGYSETFSKRLLLEAFLRENALVDVIFTTSWREGATVEELARHFSADLRDRFIGCTPVLGGPAARGAEVLYMVRRLAIECFGVVDDDLRLFPAGFPCLVLTDRQVGLTDGTIAALSRLLSRPV